MNKARTGARDELDRPTRPRLDLNAHRRVRESGHVYGSRCRAMASKSCGDGPSASVGVPLADEIDRELDDIAEIHVRRLEIAFEIVEYEAKLLERVVGDVPICRHPDLTRHHDHPFVAGDLDLM
jgi:hypothetical protein